MDLATIFYLRNHFPPWTAIKRIWTRNLVYNESHYYSMVSFKKLHIENLKTSLQQDGEIKFHSFTSEIKSIFPQSATQIYFANIPESTVLLDLKDGSVSFLFRDSRVSNGMKRSGSFMYCRQGIIISKINQSKVYETEDRRESIPW